MNTDKPRWRFMPTMIECASLIAGALFVIWYSWLMDDAYVYFRYVDNLVIHGQGLVWNPHEYVEGFSSPLWVICLILARLLHLDYWIIIRGLGIICFIAFWWMACIINRGLMANADKTKSHNIPLVYLCVNYAVLCYFTSGLETPMVNVMAAMYAAAVLWPRSKILQAIVGISPLLRHELVLPFLGFLAWAYLFKRVKTLTSCFTFILSIGAYGLFRVWYYADILPNTFYLKNTTMIHQGLRYLVDATSVYFLPSYLGLIAIAIFVLRNRYKDSDLRLHDRATMVILAAPILLYVIKIGGDPRHFRYLAFPFILIVLSTGGLTERFPVNKSAKSQHAVASLIILFAITAAMCFPRQLQQHPIFKAWFSYTHQSHLGINDPSAHRFHRTGITPPSLALTSFMSYGLARKRYKDEFAGTVQDYSPLGRPPWRCLNAVSNTPSYLVADHWCQNAYLHAAIPVIHSLGLTDAFLARIPMSSERPAHKYGLQPFALDLLKLRNVYGFKRGAFQSAVSAGDAPGWISANLEELEVIEDKVYNTHDLLENIRLAFSGRAQIVVNDSGPQQVTSAK